MGLKRYFSEKEIDRMKITSDQCIGKTQTLLHDLINTEMELKILRQHFKLSNSDYSNIIKQNRDIEAETEISQILHL